MKRGKTELREALDFLNVETKERSAASIAAEIWYKLKTPHMMVVWAYNKRLHMLSIKAAKLYENRACK